MQNVIKSKYGETRTPTSTNIVLSAWKNLTLPLGLQETEYLLPTLNVETDPKQFPFMDKPLAVSKDELVKGFEKLAPWTYHIQSGDAHNRKFGTYDDRTIEFHQFRRTIISELADDLFNHEKANLSVLDMGCNCGVFALDLADLGFGRVRGTDIRAENIAQANFLRTAFGVKNVEFDTTNVKDMEGDIFDVVLLLGLMYHMSTPFEVMRKAHEFTRSICFVDTITHKEPVSAYFVQATDTKISIEGDESFELQPTYRGIIDTMRLAGFEAVVEVVPKQKPTAELYSDCSRRCLLGIKDLNLAAKVLAKCS